MTLSTFFEDETAGGASAFAEDSPAVPRVSWIELSAPINTDAATVSWIELSAPLGGSEVASVSWIELTAPAVGIGRITGGGRIIGPF